MSKQKDQRQDVTQGQVEQTAPQGTEDKKTESSNQETEQEMPKAILTAPEEEEEYHNGPNKFVLAMKKFWNSLRHTDKNIVFGGIIAIFAVIGVIVTAIKLVDVVGDVATNQNEIAKFEKFLTPVVMLDPAPVDDMNKLGDSTIVSAALWDIILNTDPSEYASDDFSIYIPAVDVESHVKKLFGNDITYQNVAVTNSEYIFEYSPDTKMYMVPKEIQFQNYSPKVEKITKSEGMYLIQVGYIAQNNAWGSNLKGNHTEEPFKYVEYQLKSDGKNQFYIVGMEQVNESTSSTDITSSTESSSSSSETQEEQTESTQPEEETSSNQTNIYTEDDTVDSSSSQIEVQPEG